MKRIFCILIALTLVFGAISPVFAITETVDQGANTKLQNIYDKLTAFTAFFTSWWAHDGSLDSTIQEGSFQMLAINVAKLTQWFEDWIIPRNITSTTSYLGLWDYVWYIAERVNDYWPTWDSYLGAVPSIASYVSSWMTSNNSYLSSLVDSLTNKKYTTNTANSWSFADTAKYASYYLLGGSPYVGDNVYSGEYKTPVYNNGAKSNRTYNWTFSSPIGNVALLVNTVADTLANGFTDVLSGFNANLTTWNHANNTQVAFTPTSLANGLYRYLAYIQSDTGQGFYNLFNDGLREYNYYRFGVSDANRYPSNNAFTPSSLLNAYMTISTRQSYDFAMLYQHLTRMTNNTSGSNYLGWLNMISPDTLEISALRPVSLTDAIALSATRLNTSLARLAFVHADSNDIAAKRGTQANEQTITNNFLSTSGTAAASASDYAAVASSIGSVKTSLNTGVSSTGVFNVFDREYEWFSQTTLDNLDTVPNTRKGSTDTEYLDAYYRELYEIITPKSDKEFSDLIEYKDGSIYIDNEVVENDQPSR